MMKKSLLTLLLLVAGLLLTAAPQKLKTFRLKLEPGRDTYTVTPQQSGTFWIVASSKSKIPMGVQHFATLKWDDRLPMYRRLLQSNQIQKDMVLDRVIFQAGKSRTLKITCNDKMTEISQLSFRPVLPVRVPREAQSYVPPITPPDRHPRVLVNPAFLAKLKQDLNKEENAPAWKRLQKVAKRPYTFTIDPDKELQFDGKLLSTATQKAFYYLVTGDRAIGQEAIDLICKYMSLVAFGNGQDICRKVGECIYSASLIYDWCYPLLSKEQKDMLRERMLYFAAEMETGWPNFRQSAALGHGNEAQICRDQLAMAIAIYDEDPVPYKYVAYQMFENLKDLKSFEYQSGRHNQGSSYGQYRSQWDFFAALQFKRTFNYDLIDAKMGQVPYYWYYLRLPDGRFAPEGDSNWGWMPLHAAISNQLLFTAVALYRDPELKMELRRSNANIAGGNPVFFLLTNDPDLKAEDRRSSMPLAKHYQSPLPGLAVRTGWNFSPVADDAVIHLNGAGYHFRNHQHMDLGSIQMYYRGNLVSDLGQYRIYGVPYDWNLAKTSALQSLMRFHDPEQKVWQMSRRITVNTGGQDITGWSGPTNFRNLKANEARHQVGSTPRAKSGPDAARPVYSFMESDLSRLYPGRVTEHFRTFVFLNQEDNNRPGTLLVLDRFQTAKPSVTPIFQLTTIPKPVWKNGVLTVKTSQYGKLGQLTLTPLVPAKVDATILTGKAAHTFDKIHIPARNPHKPEAKGSRTELTGKGNVFLNALQLHDGLLKALPVTVREQAGRYQVDLDMAAEKGASCGGYLVSLGDAAKLTDQTFTIKVHRDNTRVLLLQLKPGSWMISGQGCTEVRPDQGSIFAVLNKGTYSVYPGKSAKKLAVPALKARVTAPQENNQLWINGRVMPGVKTTISGKHVLIPMTAFAKASGNAISINGVTMKVGDQELDVQGLRIPLPVKVDQNFSVPASVAGALLGYRVDSEDLASGLVMLTKSAGKQALESNVMMVTATENAGNLLNMLTKHQGDWIAHGRGVKADIYLARPQKLSGMVFTWPHGARRKAFWRVDLSLDGKTYETVFDGESTARQLESTIKFPARQVRAIRLYMKGNSENTWNTLGMIDFIR